MRVYSIAFHTSYQYALATAFPEIEWHFLWGVWSSNRPKPINVREESNLPFEAYDLYLAHGPDQYEEMRTKLVSHGISPRRLVYISHWSYNPEAWWHQARSKPLKQFCHEVADSPIVTVSHFMIPDFGFFSHISLEAIPHYVPAHFYNGVEWVGDEPYYINIVNDFFAPLRGTGADFWSSLNIPRRLYGSNNGEHSAGSLKSTEEFSTAVSRAKGYLWTGEKVAMSFAPLEAMACGCPLIVPDNMDWTKLFTPDYDILLYKEADEHSLLSAIERYEADETFQRQLSNNARATVSKRFSLAQFRAKWQRTIEASMSDW
ncbi:glycosyltransferase family 1 protein [Agrobacterium rosae]|uniref:glycosyltransferase n=1 Tax=Agrobacterium rosae TaxID=1972867 RepID=UPI0019D3970E|nr:glycosyltransferase [Agrobacterium rosae]MBN7809073.1 glycosyltransferase family 1 protein [Agrobacterium rosae]